MVCPASASLVLTSPAVLVRRGLWGLTSIAYFAAWMLRPFHSPLGSDYRSVCSGDSSWGQVPGVPGPLRAS